jgi:hypothetical protein
VILSKSFKVFSRSSKNLPWSCHDLAMILSWSCRDLAMILPWFCHDFAMILPWSCHDLVMILPWFWKKNLQEIATISPCSGLN